MTTPVLLGLLALSGVDHDVPSRGLRGTLEGLFETRVLTHYAHHAHRDTRMASVLSTSDACSAPRAACMSQLLFTENRNPDPKGLVAEAATCAQRQCSCAGTPDAYDAVKQVCTASSGTNLDYHYSEAYGNGTRTWYPGASCAQVEGCFSAVCDITAWKTYTAGLPACDTMWYCMRRDIEARKGACVDSATVDSSNATCAQDMVCAVEQIEAATMPEVAVDCGWEYSRVMGDDATTQKIDATCGERACLCLRRGIPGFCNDASTCCVNGQAWDKTTTTPNGVSFDLLECSEVDECVPDVTYCKMVAEPERYMPAECAGHALAMYEKGASCTSARTLFAGGAQCSAGAVTACDIVRSATVAHCDTAPLLTYQACPADTTSDATGKCICNESPGLVTSCGADGVCARVPTPTAPSCPLKETCGEHAANVVATVSGCDCECNAGWSGSRCDIEASSNDSSLPLILVALCVGAAALLLAGVGLACCCWRSQRAAQDELEEELLAREKAAQIEIPVLPETTQPQDDITNNPSQPSTIPGSTNTNTNTATQDNGSNTAPASLTSVPTSAPHVPAPPSSPLPPLAQAPTGTLQQTLPLGIDTEDTLETLNGSHGHNPLEATQHHPSHNHRTHSISAAPQFTTNLKRGRRTSFVGDSLSAQNQSMHSSNVTAPHRRNSRKRSASDPSMAAAMALAHAEMEREGRSRTRSGSGHRTGSRSRSGRKERRSGSQKDSSRTPSRSRRKSSSHSLRGDPEVEEAITMLHKQLDEERAAGKEQRSSSKGGGGGGAVGGRVRSGSTVAIVPSETPFTAEVARGYKPLSPPMAQRDSSTSLTARQAELLARHL